MDVADLRKHIKREIENAKKDAEDRRRTGDAAQAEYTTLLNTVIVPLLKQTATVLKSEGLGFQTFTPVGSARLVSDRSSEEFVEFGLDVASAAPQVVGRVSLQRGRQGMFVEERAIAPGKRIGEVGESDILDFLMNAIRKLISR